MGVKKVVTLWIMIIIIIGSISISLQTAAENKLCLIDSPRPDNSSDDKNNTEEQAQDNRIAIIDTSYGEIKFELFEKRAPITTANFINLSKDFFYDGILFHRVIDDFVIQTGDPNSRDDENPYNDGSGGSSQTIPLEIHPELTHVDGAVGMARSTDPDSASSQFYICDGPQHGLDGDYAVFGLVIDGIDVVRKIAQVETWGNKRPLLKDHPIEDVVMYTVFIAENESEYTYTPPGDEESLWSSWKAPGFEVAILLAAIVIILLSHRKIRC